jgi:hypothetical protein
MPCTWVTQAQVQAALGDLAPGFKVLPVARSTLVGVGSPEAPDWDLSCKLYVNANMDSAGTLELQTGGFSSPGAAQHYLKSHPPELFTQAGTTISLNGVGDSAVYTVSPYGYGARLAVLDKARFTLISLGSVPSRMDISPRLVALYKTANLP